MTLNSIYPRFPQPFPILAIVAAFLGSGISSRAEDKEPAVARTVDVVDKEYGLTLPDPYRWMEGEKNEEFLTWLKAQGEATRRNLDQLPGLADWQKRLAKISGGSRINRLQKLSGGRVFFLRLEGKSKGILMVQEADGSERILLDPATLDGGNGHASITEYAPSPDGRLLALNIDHTGNEVTRLQVLDVEKATFLPDSVEPVWGEFTGSWLPDGNGFTYTQMAPEKERSDGDPMQDMRVRLHHLGTPAEQDPILLRVGSNPALPLKSNEFPIIAFVPDSKWALAFATGARSENRVYVAERAEALQPTAKWRPIADYADQVQFGVLHADTLYLLSVKDHPNGRLLAIDLTKENPSLQDAREVLPMSPEAVITEIAGARDGLYIKRMSAGLDGFLRLDYASGKSETIQTPFAGSAYLFDTDPAEDGFLFTLQSWTLPRVVYRYEPASGKLRDLNLTATSPGDYSEITSSEVEATSADGTRVPLSIIHRKDIQLDGKNRALVDGYGGYGQSQQPRFQPSLLEWVKAGHVYAEAHVRGGGEKGESWHRGGQGILKYKGVEDFFACAGELARLGYTTPARTALEGRSAGGVLAGGALVSGPEKIGAVIIGVGILNPVRLLAAANGANQFAEFGDPRTEEGYQALAAMDPYQHIHEGTAYPAVLLPIGLHDSRVSPWETGKFAARLRTATSSKNPIWIRTDANTGHFGISLDDQAAELADIYAFLEAQLPGR